MGTYPISSGDISKIVKSGSTAIFNLQTGNDMTERKAFWPQIKQESRKAGINKVMSFPISDKNESEYMDDLFAAAQHLNDLINEQ